MQVELSGCFVKIETVHGVAYGVYGDGCGVSGEGCVVQRVCTGDGFLSLFACPLSCFPFLASCLFCQLTVVILVLCPQNYPLLGDSLIQQPHCPLLILYSAVTNQIGDGIIFVC